VIDRNDGEGLHKSGQAEMADIDRLEILAKTIKAGSLCGLGQTAPNPVLTTLRYFRDEYEAHIIDHHCSAGVCPDLITYEITDACNGCTLCVRICPVDGISGEKKQMHVIDPKTCIRCGACYESCNYNAIVVN